MSWKCSECRNSFAEDDKKYKYQLCKTCYFDANIHKAYRTGEKQPYTEPAPIQYDPSPPPSAPPHEPDPYCMSRAELTDEEKHQLIKNGWREEKLHQMMTGKINGLKVTQCDIFGPIVETGRWSAANPPQTALPKEYANFKDQVREMIRHRHRATPLQFRIVELEDQLAKMRSKATEEEWEAARQRNRSSGMMPDLTGVCLDMMELRLMVLKLFKHLGVDLPPDVLK